MSEEESHRAEQQQTGEATIRLSNSAINELDDLETAVLWMNKGRVDTKGLAKYLPYTCQDLAAGTVTPEQVAAELQDLYNVRSIRLKNVNQEMDPIMCLCHLTAFQVLPSDFFRGRNRDKREDISVPFSADLQENFQARCQGELSPENSTVLLKQSIDEVCEQWADRLDDVLFYKKRGSFLRKCPLYGKTPESLSYPGGPMRIFMDDMDTEWSKEQTTIADYRKTSLLDAARNVVKGMHDIKRICWECGEVCDSKKECGKCAAAMYCSRKCQVAAWKGGHKNKCDALASRYSQFLDSLQVIEEAHNSDMQLIYGFTLSDELDYRVLGLVYATPSPYEGTGSEKMLAEPSMKAFYENLERVVRGEWWFYEDADDAVYQQAQIASEEDYFIMLCAFMCYDYFGALTECSGCEPDSAAVTASFSETSFVMLAKNEQGAAMPASRFLEIYQSARNSEDYTDRFRLQREIRNSCIYEFRERFHK